MCVGPVHLAVVPKRRDSSKNRNSHTLVAEIPTSPMIHEEAIAMW
jgi:hypothetical protein